MVSTPLKIVVAGPAGQHGGLEIHTAELVRYLRKNNFLVLHIEISKAVVNQHSPFLKFIKLFNWLNAFAKARFFCPHLLISTATGNGYRWLAQLSSSDCFRVIQIVTEDYPENDPRMLSILNAHDAVAAQTPLLQHQVNIKLSKSIPCQSLPCFHQIRESHLPKLRNESLPENGFRLAYFGRLAGNKGLVELLHVWQHLHLSSSHTLDIWGSGPMNTDLVAILKNSPKLKESVILQGPYPAGSAYNDLLSSYHGLVLPSQATEGLPLVLLEAAAFGLPILTTSIGGIPDFAESNPDVVMVGIGVDSLHLGLEQFIRLLKVGYFNRERHQHLFQSYYSLPVIETQWALMLQDPSFFFRSST